MIRVICLFVISFFLVTSSYACIQGLQELSDGRVVSVENQNLFIPKGNTLIPQDENVLFRLDSLWKATKNVDYLSDYGMVLIVNGKYEEAKNSYLQIEKIKPNQYPTASNLGTLYELLGDNKNALTWIQKAVKLNPVSHDSSEWLHVRILEAKINGAPYVNTNFLLHTDFGRDSIPASELSKTELLHLQKALFYQLNERLTFIHSSDKIVAQLLFDLANISLLTGVNIYQVNDIYSMAKKYGYEGPLWDKRSTYAKHLSLKINKGQVDTPAHKREEVKTPEVDFPWAIILGVCFLIAPVFMFFYLKSKMNTSNPK
ncbi:tetratricopeptide repeat protein [Cytophaga aurantiaca]|uniref:tetratricopeptide repeat protein n=1 Tax=Cytophaga aurantiaca TaxID=29530 RepID=UPI00037BC0C9|nr:tetratricopeptide repeat protein [Cytophaga aurantiaca]